MAMNSGGGGPWGGGGGGGNGDGGGENPWGGGGKKEPVNLNDMIRRGQDEFRKAMPKGGGGANFELGSKGIILILIAGFLAWLGSGIYRVDTEEQGVVLVFGRWVGTTPPGLHYNWPAPIGKIFTPGVTRVNRIELGFRGAPEAQTRRVAASGREINDESLMLTGDENIVDINFTVFWKIKDAGAYLFKIRDPKGTVKVAAESAMRDIISQTPIQAAFTEGRSLIEQRVRNLMQSLLDSYDAGIEITQVQLLKVDPPSVVVDAFNDVQRARADRERLRNEAEGYRNDVIPRARGEAEKLIQEAEAYKEQVLNLAQGDAKRFISVYDTYKDAKDITIKRLYLETMEQTLRGSNKVIMDTKGGQSILPYLPLPELKPAGAKP